MQSRRHDGYMLWWVVPHTGIAASLRWSPTEYGCYGGLRPDPGGSDWLEGTNEGTGPRRHRTLLAALVATLQLEDHLIRNPESQIRAS